MFKKILTKLLLRILRDLPTQEAKEAETKKVQEMFWGIYPTKEWRGYLARRELDLLRIIGLGTKISREEYLQYCGQRDEILNLNYYSKQCYETIEAQKKKRSIKNQ